MHLFLIQDSFFESGIQGFKNDWVNNGVERMDYKRRSIQEASSNNPYQTGWKVIAEQLGIKDFTGGHTVVTASWEDVT